MRLITFGDSWPHGFGVSKPYGKVLSEKMGFEFVNMSENATSNEHMLLQLRKYIETNQSVTALAIFFITSPHRCLFYENGHPIEIYPWVNTTNGEKNHAYFKYLQSSEIEHFRLNQTVLALQKICSAYAIKDFYFSGWHKLRLDWPGIDLDKVFERGQITAADWIGATSRGDMIDWESSPNVMPGNCHPNQRGHEIIAEHLAEWILCQD